MFGDRRDAGRRLAAALQAYCGPDTLVLGVPRGGVVVAAEVARALNAPLDVVVPRKIGAPCNPELAVGALGPDGVATFDPNLLRYFGLTPEDLEDEVERERAEQGRRLRLYRGDRPPLQVAGRVVVVVDDGIATGFTIRAALQALRRAQPARLVLAVPVAPADTLRRLRPEADDLVCLYTPEPFYAVGQFYLHFDQTGDDEVVELLRHAGPAPAGPPPRGGPAGCNAHGPSSPGE
ncbi:MAG: phosphoribosyltransferase [Acetobacteraceae bacterium]|nr:phosphoribosyltransferase [Acetobacteraceae bacterium]